MTGDWPTWPQWTDADLTAVREVIDSGRWNGVDAPAVTDFEQRWAAYTGARHAICAANGTDSLLLGLRALGVGPGDEVIVPAYTFLATASAVALAGATPVFADIDPDSYCLDPAAVDAAVTPRTAAVIAVHLGGHPADMDALGALCRRRGLALVEDAAHAHGARHRDRPVGALADLASWSFQGSKNLTAGEGGALTTNDDGIAERMRSLRNQGRVAGGAWYEHHVLGWNSRLTAMQAALLRAGLDRLTAQVAAREAAAGYLDEHLPGTVTPQGRAPWVTVHAHHLYLFRYGRGPVGEFVEALRALDIPAVPGYPVPLYRQPLFAGRYDGVHLPETERACRETVWLPHELLLAPVERMAEVVAAVEKATR
ncbi:dTDP-4-amino-4,6-dideoxygalactose transaminase [Micromonospora rhizosphaerae]|uniref:dTDP-4-amino-4,6-dideoxygalactose transaminase n=1 Tax=Micromonospora rhizosphaerae TaxID=568872 RepID=A0A1C6SB50_9ACTN|nr:DegT/DnrJ/EryC1/StrS family aminotransferase [Micromonospora rhizosphaerae]SCL26636.1 dTDP-4-amino-4,6-dideoxygalactose transaminase [Micromonospora rhizosphaerae]